jgi:CO/xanthine dehydrogenase Mo-binding subunit
MEPPWKRSVDTHERPSIFGRQSTRTIRKLMRSWRHASCDGRLKVTGEALYGSDFLVANPAYGIFVTSSIAKGRIEAMELSEGKAARTSVS